MILDLMVVSIPHFLGECNLCHCHSQTFEHRYILTNFLTIKILKGVGFLK
jgi:hypothetical protein